MNALVVYDSQYGNTEAVARAIGEALAPCAVVPASEATSERLTGVDLLVVGSPTQRFRPTPAASAFLASIPPAGLKGVRVAAFDTRFSVKKARSMSALLGFFVRLLGRAAYAASPLAKKLEQLGGTVVAPPEGFLVQGLKGPLEAGELERAGSWSLSLRQVQGPQEQAVPGRNRGRPGSRSQGSGS